MFRKAPDCVVCSCVILDRQLVTGIKCHREWTRESSKIMLIHPVPETGRTHWLPAGKRPRPSLTWGRVLHEKRGRRGSDSLCFSRLRPRLRDYGETGTDCPAGAPGGSDGPELAATESSPPLPAPSHGREREVRPHGDAEASWSLHLRANTANPPFCRHDPHSPVGQSHHPPGGLRGRISLIQARGDPSPPQHSSGHVTPLSILLTRAP